MHMGIALMAAQRHEINPLGRERGLQRLGHVTHHITDPPEQLTIPRHIDNVSARRYNRVAEQCRISAEERHHIIVNEYMLMLVLRVPAEVSAHEARSSSG